MKICIECKWCVKDFEDVLNSLCAHADTRELLSPVTGFRHMATCASARFLIEDRCGYEGKLYEPKYPVDTSTYP